MKNTWVTVAAVLAALLFGGAWLAECRANRMEGRDVDIKARVAQHVQDAERANKNLVEALRQADVLQEQADAAKARADALQDERSLLEKTLRTIQRKRRAERKPAKTLEQCNLQLQRADADCNEHVAALTEAFDLQRATSDALRQGNTASQAETKEERAARILETGRAEGWKKSARRQRRQKILIGVGAGLGGVALTLGAAYAANKVGN